MKNVSALLSPTTAPSGTATTAETREVSELKPLGEAHIAALIARGFEVEMVARLGVGASTRLGGVSIGIPYLTATPEGSARLGCKHRTLEGDKRFMQDKGSAQVFYNGDCLRDESLKAEPLVITEGELDCWSALQAGYPKSVSVPGGAPMERLKEDSGRKYAFIEVAWPQLEAVDKIILATDDDEPGANLRADLALRLGAYRCHWVRYPKGCKDLNDALRLYGERGVQATLQRAAPMQIHGYYEFDELPPAHAPRAHDCGMDCLGRHYKLRLGDMTVVTGVPGHGKSSFINEVCCRMTEAHGWKTVFASFEQAPQTDHRRALRTFKLRKLERDMRPEEMAATDAWIRRHFGFIVPGDDDEVTLEWMLQVLEQAVLRKEAQIVVIDPWNEMDHTRPREMSLTEYTGFAIKSFKRFARKLNVHLIVAAHPAKMTRAKDGKYPVPSLYDIADSAHWANKPDVGIIIHRADLSINETTIKVAKARYASIGVPGEIKGAWHVDQTRYLITDDGGIRGDA
jgi:twinkle protein